MAWGSRLLRHAERGQIHHLRMLPLHLRERDQELIVQHGLPAYHGVPAGLQNIIPVLATARKNCLRITSLARMNISGTEWEGGRTGLAMGPPALHPVQVSRPRGISLAGRRRGQAAGESSQDIWQGRGEVLLGRR